MPRLASEFDLPIPLKGLFLIGLAIGCNGPADTWPPVPEDTQVEVIDTVDTSAPEDTEQLPILEAGEGPFEHVFAPATLVVDVFDVEGLPMADMPIEVEGTILVTDDRGKATFGGLAPGSVSILGGGSDGWASKSRSLTLLDGEHVTTEVVLVEVGTSELFDSTEGITIGHGGVLVVVPPNGVLDIFGEPYEGEVTLEMTGYDADDESLFPGPLIAIDSEGEQALVTHGAFEATLEGEDGLPLQVDPENPLTVSVGTDLEEGYEVAMWFLDPTTGLWLEEPGLNAVVEDGELTVDIPHLTLWNFDEKQRPCCVRIDIDVCDDMLDEIEVSGWGNGWFRRGPVPDGQLHVLRAPCGPANFLLWHNGEVIDRLENVTMYPFPQPGLCPYVGGTLEADWSGDTSAQIFVEFRAAGCPAERVWVTATTQGGAEVFAELAEGISIAINELTPDVYDVCIWDPADLTEPLDCKTVDVECPPGDICECPDTIELNAGGRFLAEGVDCNDFCTGENCDSCVEVEVMDNDGNPLNDTYVDLYHPIGQSIPTDDEGEICLDVEGLADYQVTVAAEGAWPAAVRLPRGAQCSDGDCARVQQVASGDAIICPTGTARVLDDSRLFGFLDPQYTADASYNAPVNSIGTVAVSSAGYMASALSGGWSQEAWGFRRMQQNPAGDESVDALVFRADMGDAGVSIELEGLPSLGTYAVAEQPVTVVLDHFPSTTLPITYTATSGTVRVKSRVGQRWFVDMDLQLESEDETIAFSATVVVHELFEADIPRKVAKQRSHHLNGTWVSVTTPDTDVLWGPGGQFAPDPEWPTGQLEYCVSLDGPYMLVGMPADNHHVPFTAMMEVSADLEIILYDNGHEDSFAYAQHGARWFEKQYVRTVYEVNELDPNQAKAGATIFGQASRWTGSSLEPIVGAQVYLQRDEGGELVQTPCPLLNPDFSFRYDGGGSTFACTGVEPAGMDDPYTLVVLDADGQEVSAMQQLIAPVAGGVMVAHN
jgi:hypothetical protein